MKSFIVALMLVVALSLSAGCNKEKLAVATYEGVGQVLVEFKNEVESKHARGEINEEFYVKAKATYANARLSYIAAGNALKLIIDIEDAVQRGAKLSESLESLDEARGFIVSFIAALEANGVKLDKVSSLISKLKS